MPPALPPRDLNQRHRLRCPLGAWILASGLLSSLLPVWNTTIAQGQNAGAEGGSVVANAGGSEASEDEVLARLKAQERRILELERAAGKLPLETPAPAADIPKRPPEEGGWVKWNELAAGQSRLKFYGFLRVDGIVDDSRPNNTQVIGYVRSEDPAAPPSIGSPKDSGDFTLHPRLTRFGLDLSGPEVELLAGAKVSGKLEIDFYNSSLSGQSESRAAIRMRHAYLKLAWGDLYFLGGQTSDIISPNYPIVNPDLVMWGAGNLGDRRPQLRLEYAPKPGSSQLVLQGEVGLTGAVDNSDIDPAGTTGAGYRDGETSGKPTLQARAAYKLSVWEKQALEVGVWGHRAWEEPDTRFGGTNDFDSVAGGVDLTIPVYKDIVTIKGELWYGKNVDDIRGGIFQGINTTTGEEIRARGGWVELGVKPIAWLSIHGGYSQDDPIDSDLPTAGRAVNRIPYAAIRFYPDPVEIGLDYLHWTTDYKGFDEGVDNRFQFYISYKF